MKAGSVRSNLMLLIDGDHLYISDIQYRMNCSRIPEIWHFEFTFLDAVFERRVGYVDVEIDMRYLLPWIV